MVITLRSNMVRVSPPTRVRLLAAISANRTDRTTMNKSVGRRGMTSTGTGIYIFELSRFYASERRAASSEQASFFPLAARRPLLAIRSKSYAAN
jgi:hypothetical protein